MTVFITSNSKVTGGHISTAVAFAVQDIERDIAKTTAPSDRAGADIVLVEEPHEAETWEIRVEGGAIEVHAGDDFGFIYGLYAISRELLGVKDFWFWNDQRFDAVAAIEVADDFTAASRPTAVRYKGFFINDEVLLEDWAVDNDRQKPWRLAFETIYRLGGNLVIPGSGQNGEPHLQLARDMGFYINQHHACPLGAQMFAAAYPGVKPQWPEQRDRFEALWKAGIEDCKKYRTVWTLGFRGQGDSPFWAADPRYDTDEKRGRLLSEIIRYQYDLVQQAQPGAPCVIYLYGEIMDLYRKGVLTYPKDVIKIWADNGFGRMVSRRQGDWDPRIPAMPEGDGRNGIYYHASFYDLQAANHITQLCVDPRLVSRELGDVLDRNGGDVWIVNASNIKPHVYFLNLIASIWRDGRNDAERVCRDYIAGYYGTEDADDIFGLFEEYWKSSAAYGPEWDQRVGEQTYTYMPRYLTLSFLRDPGEPAHGVDWLFDADLRGQIEAFRALCASAAERYRALDGRVESLALSMEARGRRDAATLLRDTLGVAVGIYAHCSAGCVLVCQALEEAGAGGGKPDYARAFYHAGLSREEFSAGDAAMRSREHGVWGGYWRNDCLADVKQSAMVMGQFMGWLRMVGDDMNYCGWKRRFTYPEWERDVWVLMNMENHETDDEIFEAMKKVWQK